MSENLTILNVTTIREWRGGDNQMYMIFKLLESKSDLKQFILCPNNSVLAKKCAQEKSAFFTYFRNKFKLFNLTREIIKICNRENVDVVHVHDSSALNGALLATMFIPRIRIVLSRKRDNAIKDKWMNRYKYSHPKILKIISVSKSVERIFDNIIVDKSRLLTIYDAVDVQKLATKENRKLLHREFNLADDVKIVGNVAGLTEQKDLFTFIDTAAMIRRKSTAKLAFIIIGEGPLRADLERYAVKNGVGNELIFAGFRNNVEDLLPEFDVFLLTSINEGLPLTIYEAFACKVPVVSTDAGGTREVVRNGETGFICAIKDSEALSNRVIEMLADDDLVSKIVENAFHVAKANHDLPVLQENYYRFYVR